MLQIGVLASHQGTNFQAIADACTEGELDAVISVLVCNNASAPVLSRARNAGIPTRHLSSKTHPDPDDLDNAICTSLVNAGVRLVVLAGYMKKLGDQTLKEFAGRMINVHPSLLPRHGGEGFYGTNVHEAVLNSGDRTTGATVHLVTKEYDSGDILLQEEISVLDTDDANSLAARIHPLEHKLLISAVRNFAMES